VRLRPRRHQAVERSAGTTSVLHLRSATVGGGLHGKRIRPREAADRCGRGSSPQAPPSSPGRSATSRRASQGTFAVTRVKIIRIESSIPSLATILLSRLPAPAVLFRRIWRASASRAGLSASLLDPSFALVEASSRRSTQNIRIALFRRWLAHLDDEHRRRRNMLDPSDRT
jgi:hypothetical protein